MLDVKKMEEHLEQVKKVTEGLKTARESNNTNARMDLFQSVQFMQLASKDLIDDFNNFMSKVSQIIPPFEEEMKRCMDDKIPEKLSERYIQKAETEVKR